MGRYLVTGGAGFIGSHFVEYLVSQGHELLVFDLLTYAGLKENLDQVPNEQYKLTQGDLRNPEEVDRLFSGDRFDGVFHFAAESHVDRSIVTPQQFIETNVIGTFHLLKRSHQAWEDWQKPEPFRFVQVSTDEVYGQLHESEEKFSEQSPYRPNSPYSASKAAADHLVRAWHHTYGFPTLVTNCSNNFGPRQSPEKLIPRMILCALRGESLPVYGEGKNIRDWISVHDHVRGIWLAYDKTQDGQTYCFGGNCERQNIELVREICTILDRLRPKEAPYAEQIVFVPDRKGHDFRYAIDDSKARKDLGFENEKPMPNALEETIQWYLDNRKWCELALEKLG